MYRLSNEEFFLINKEVFNKYRYIIYKNKYIGDVSMSVWLILIGVVLVIAMAIVCGVDTHLLRKGIINKVVDNIKVVLHGVSIVLFLVLVIV